MELKGSIHCQYSRIEGQIKSFRKHSELLFSSFKLEKGIITFFHITIEKLFIFINKRSTIILNLKQINSGRGNNKFVDLAKAIGLETEVVDNNTIFQKCVHLFVRGTFTLEPLLSISKDFFLLTVERHTRV